MTKVSILIPDREWYKNESQKLGVVTRCEFANLQKCPKYYYTYTFLLKHENELPAISDNISVSIKNYWKDKIETDLLTLNYSIGGFSAGGKPADIDNMCPEVSFQALKYYASSVSYPCKDEISYYQQKAQEENLKNDWRYYFSSVTGEHYTDCNCYEQILTFHKDGEKQKIQVTQHYINIDRINELKSIKSDKFCLDKLILLCEEINSANQNEAHLSIIMLLRSLFDHIPPIFEKKNFDEFISQYRFTSNPRNGDSVKNILKPLAEVTKEIGNFHIHKQISKHRTLPNKIQVDFRASLDVLLNEIINKLNE